MGRTRRYSLALSDRDLSRTHARGEKLVTVRLTQRLTRDRSLGRGPDVKTHWPSVGGLGGALPPLPWRTQPSPAANARPVCHSCLPAVSIDFVSRTAF